MLRSNLATRPFYNERAVHALLALAAVLILALTAFNLFRIVTLSRHNTELSARIGADRGEADRLRDEARRIRAGIKQDELEAIALAAQQANQLIDQRTFSWTELFNHIEATLPPDVMLTSVQPSFNQGSSMISMNVLARRTEDVEEFMNELEATGAFDNVLFESEDLTEEGLHRVLLRAAYVGPAAEDTGEAAGEPPAPTKPPAAPAAASASGDRAR